jgi:hypothetical protein
MRHGSDSCRLDGLELVHHGDDARQLGRDVGDLFGADFKPSEPTKSVDVFGAKHGFLGATVWLKEGLKVGFEEAAKSAVRNEVIDFSLDNTRRLWIGLPVVKVAPRFP